MTIIGLIRHGITDWNELGKAQGISDIPLNQAGLRQAEAIANRVSQERWDLVYSSDLTRAYKTSEVISAALGIDSITTDERLREINCGLIEGTTEEERFLQWGEEWRLKEIGMEPYDEVAMRGIEFLDEVSIRHPDQHVLIVSHGALIGLTLQRLLPEFFTKTYIDNAALTVIERNRDNIWQCNLYNCTKHLGSR